MRNLLKKADDEKERKRREKKYRSEKKQKREEKIEKDTKREKNKNAKRSVFAVTNTDICRKTLLERES